MSTKLYKLLDEYRKAEIESSKSVKKVCKLPVTKTYTLYLTNSGCPLFKKHCKSYCYNKSYRS